MLKLKLTTIEGLDPKVAAEYKKDEATGIYLLDTDVPFEDVTPLKTALQAERTHRKTATEQVTALTEKVTTLEARAGSATDLEKSWQAKLDKAKKDGDAEKAAIRTQLEKVLVDNEAIRIANEVSTAPELLIPHIRARLTLEEDNGTFLTRVLDPDGKMSAASVKDLQGEIVANKSYAAIIKASSASGGGASGGKGVPAGGKKKFSEMNEAELTALHGEVGDAKFKQMAAEAKAAPASAPAPAT